MIFRYLDTNNCIYRQLGQNFIVKLASVKDLWIFNCTEGCQSNIFNQSFRINNLSKIIISDLNINNISGLLGLLSSLNLMGRSKPLHIYAPFYIKYYIDLIKKYSHTNFSYIVYIHVFKAGLIISHHNYRIYTFISNNIHEFILIKSEEYGKFSLNKATNNYLVPGPLYGKLKKGFSFLFPDGSIIDGIKLTSVNLLGKQLCFFVSFYYKRIIVENSIFSRIVLIA
uniref:Ribonuclease Z n=1 Tax=Sonderella linearis TaxID=110477 RepID=A0A1Z1MLZ7_9FLOR|nr:ribonuclease Z [Sonderella linearis]ARW66956.1 ribonuclease Z [Sonderella linearis]